MYRTSAVWLSGRARACRCLHIYVPIRRYWYIYYVPIRRYWYIASDVLIYIHNKSMYRTAAVWRRGSAPAYRSEGTGLKSYVGRSFLIFCFVDANHRKWEPEVVHTPLEGCNRNLRPKAAEAKVFHGKSMIG